MNQHPKYSTCPTVGTRIRYFKQFVEKYIKYHSFGRIFFSSFETTTIGC
jgi:hypothetical protein